MAQMLTLYRRHQKDCAHRSEGRKYRRCTCPVWVDGILSGHPIRQSLDTRSWEKGSALIRDWEVEGRVVKEERRQIEIAEAASRFLADAEGRRLAHATVKKYRVLLDQLAQFCTGVGIRFLHQLDLDFLRQFRESWKDGDLSSLKKLERLRGVCKFWKRSGWMAKNFAKGIARPRVTAPPTLPFTREEVADLLGAVGRLGGSDLSRRRMYALIMLMRYSGLRIGDAVRLHHSKLNGNLLRLYTQKTGTHVEVPLPPFVISKLQELPLENGFFFVSGSGTAATGAGNYRRAFRRLRELAGLPDAHPHRFRDTFAVEALQDGVAIDRVAVFLGHRSIRITERHYAPWVKSRQELAQREMERTWSREMPAPADVVAIRKAAG